MNFCNNFFKFSKVFQKNAVVEYVRLKLRSNIMYSFEKFKEALKKREEERFQALKLEIKKVREIIEKILTKCLESSSNLARTNYQGLDMY